MGIDYAGMTERAAQMLKDAQDSGAAAATAPAAAAGDAAAAETGAAPGGLVCLHVVRQSTHAVHSVHKRRSARSAWGALRWRCDCRSQAVRRRCSGGCPSSRQAQGGGGRRAAASRLGTGQGCAGPHLLLAHAGVLAYGASHPPVHCM